MSERRINGRKVLRRAAHAGGNEDGMALPETAAFASDAHGGGRHDTSLVRAILFDDNA